MAEVVTWALSGPRSQVAHAINLIVTTGSRAACGKHANHRSGWLTADAQARRCPACKRRVPVEAVDG